MLCGQLDRGIPPGVPKPSHCGGTPRSSWPCFQHYPKHPLPILWSGAKAVGGVPEPAVLYTRPCGVPSVGREPEKHRFAPFLSAHLRRQVQPHRRLLSRRLHIYFNHDGELGERLNFASIRREIQALSQRLWNHAREIGSGCSSNDGKRSATLVCTPEVPGVRNAGGIARPSWPHSAKDHLANHPANKR